MWFEYIVVIVAAMLAGIGTGLVGLSAATAMVPLLIVLCPTFGGEPGAYMATAIALASDILGSAVTTVVCKGVGDNSVQQAENNHQHLSERVALGVKYQRRHAYQRCCECEVIRSVKCNK